MQVLWKDQVATFSLPCGLQSVSYQLQDGRTALTVAIQVGQVRLKKKAKLART